MVHEEAHLGTLASCFKQLAPRDTDADRYPPYDVHYDRGPSIGSNAWNMTAPDGIIDLVTDILGVIDQWSPLGCT